MSFNLRIAEPEAVADVPSATSMSSPRGRASRWSLRKGDIGCERTLRLHCQGYQRTPPQIEAFR